MKTFVADVPFDEIDFLFPEIKRLSGKKSTLFIFKRRIGGGGNHNILTNRGGVTVSMEVGSFKAFCSPFLITILNELKTTVLSRQKTMPR